MSHKSKKIVGHAIEDPEKLYKSPESVLADSRLTQAEKDKILHSWEQDQFALLRAEEENMPSKNNAPSPEDMLDKIKKAEKVLEDTESRVKQRGQSKLK